MKIKLMKTPKAKKSKRYPKQRPFRLYNIGGKMYYKHGGKMLAYGGQYEDEYGSYQKSDGTEEGKAYTGQVASGVATGVEAGSSMGVAGMAIGAVAGLIGGAVGGGAEVEKMKAEQVAARGREHDRREGIAKSVLGNYPTKGVAGNHAMYKNGGNMKGDPPNARRNAMMKGAIARNSGIPFVKRMTQQDPANIPTGKDAEGYDSYGTHQLGSYGKYVLPRIVREGSSLKQLPEDGVYDYHAKQGFKNAMTFDNNQDAIDFAQYYKDVAPMSEKYRQKAYGGNIYAGGGNMPQGVNPQQFQPVASDVNVVNGASHEQGGVSAGGGNEVEGGEVTNQQDDGSTNVFSDRIEFAEGITFAQAAAEIGKKKGKYEERLESNSIFIKGTARREVEKLDGELQRLFVAQETKKQEMGIPDPNQQAAEQQAMEQQQGAEQQIQQEVQGRAQPEMQGQPQGPGQFAMGGKFAYGSSMYYNGGSDPRDVEAVGQISKGLFGAENYARTQEQDFYNKSKPIRSSRVRGQNPITGKAVMGVAQGILPYVDNIANAISTANMPAVPKPVPYRNVPLKTDYNINPQIAAINAAEATRAGALHQNTKGSGSYRTNLIASGVASIAGRNQLYGEKFNRETAMINANRMNVQKIGIGNVDKETAYDMLNLQRKGQIRTEISQNITQATDDTQLAIREKNLMKRDQLEMKILEKQYKDSGVWDRNLQKLINDYNKGLIGYTEFSAGMKVYDTKIANKKDNTNN